MAGRNLEMNIAITGNIDRSVLSSIQQAQTAIGSLGQNSLAVAHAMQETQRAIKQVGNVQALQTRRSKARKSGA